MGERARSVEPQGAHTIPRCGPALGRAHVGCGHLGARLRLPLGLLFWHSKNRNFCLFHVQFREYFLCRISETKNSRKQELALWHLVNMLVPKNA